MTTVFEVLDQISDARSNSEAGTSFEKLMVVYFHRDPLLAARYSDVMRWVDWPHRGTSADVGIDLVARDRLSDTWTAIQCKFYASNHYLNKSDIDSFFTASGKTWDGVAFTNRIIISTTKNWSKHAEDALADQLIPVQRIGLEELAQAPIDWHWGHGDIRVELSRTPHFTTRPHQDAAINAIMDGFTTHDRGQWISACGTGKTFTSLRLAEKIASSRGGGGLTLCGFCSLLPRFS